MSETTTEDNRRGGLPEDDAIAAAFTAATSRRRRKPREDKPEATEQTHTVAAPAEPAAAGLPTPSRPRRSVPQSRDEPAAEVEVHRDTRPAAAPPRPQPVATADLVVRRQGTVAEQRSTQCTVNVSTSVRDRFSAYQLQKKLDQGAEPTNAVVVRRAVLHARKHDLFAEMLEYVRHSQVPHDDEDDDPEGLFGDVQGRRAERGRSKDTRQLPFRPSYKELAVIDALAAGYGFGNRSEFLDAALDAFLPRLQEKRRR